MEKGWKEIQETENKGENVAQTCLGCGTHEFTACGVSKSSSQYQVNILTQIDGELSLADDLLAIDS